MYYYTEKIDSVAPEKAVGLFFRMTGAGRMRVAVIVESSSGRGDQLAVAVSSFIDQQAD